MRRGAGPGVQRLHLLPASSYAARMRRMLGGAALSLALVGVCDATLQADDLRPRRWGVSAAFVGGLPVGGYTAQSGAADEFEPFWGMELTLPNLRLGAHWELLAYGRFKIGGGSNAAVYEAAFDPALSASRPRTRDMSFGGALRYFHVLGLADLELYGGLYAGLAQVRARYTPPADPNATASPFGGAAPSVRRYHGPELGLGVGLNRDLPLGAEGVWGTVPLFVELRYVAQIFHDIDGDPAVVARPELLHTDNFVAHQLLLSLGVGYTL